MPSGRTYIERISPMPKIAGETASAWSGHASSGPLVDEHDDEAAEQRAAAPWRCRRSRPRRGTRSTAGTSDLVGVGRDGDEHRARARDPGVERAERERESPSLRAMLMPTVSRRGLVVAHRDERPAEAAAHDQPDDDRAEDRDARRRHVVRPLVVATDRGATSWSGPTPGGAASRGVSDTRFVPPVPLHEARW